MQAVTFSLVVVSKNVLLFRYCSQGYGILRPSQFVKLFTENIDQDQSLFVVVFFLGGGGLIKPHCSKNHSTRHLYLKLTLLCLQLTYLPHFLGCTRHTACRIFGVRATGCRIGCRIDWVQLSYGAFRLFTSCHRLRGVTPVVILVIVWTEIVFG